MSKRSIEFGTRKKKTKQEKAKEKAIAKWKLKTRPLISDKVFSDHCRQNAKIRKSRKEIIKPDLDAIMDLALSPSPKNN